MKRNLKKELNNGFVKMTCDICLDIFDADEKYIYKITYSDGYACYNCGRESEAKIIKRLNKKIAYLKRQKDILIK